jgi:hypothetical protein
MFVKLGIAALVLVSASATTQAANYELHSHFGGYICQSQSTNVAAGRLQTVHCTAAIPVIDKDTGIVYSCSAIIWFSLLNGQWQREEPQSRTTYCGQLIQGLLRGVTSWSLGPSFDAPTDSNYSTPTRPWYYWYTSGAQIGVCVAIPFQTGHFPKQWFGQGLEGLCLTFQPGDIKSTPPTTPIPPGDSPLP